MPWGFCRVPAAASKVITFLLPEVIAVYHMSYKHIKDTIVCALRYLSHYIVMSRPIGVPLRTPKYQ